MIRISCFCTGTTFPNGEATTSRIIMIGKALQLRDAQFTIYLNSEGNKNALNNRQKGTVDGLEFIHLNRSMKIHLPRWKRIWNYFIIGFFYTAVIVKNIAKDRNHVVYLYSHGSVYNVWVSVIARLFGVPVVQEVNEWPDEKRKRLHKLIYQNVMFRWAKGAIVISENIELQVQRFKKSNSFLKTVMLPVLADGGEWENTPLVEKTFVWCGLIEGYFRDVVFMINAFSKIHADYPDYTLIICGKYRPETEKRIDEVLRSCNVPKEKVKLTGFISNEQLIGYCQSATALISPLWNDQASVARFPTKIAGFLFSGRPVVTCNIGEVGKYLREEETALFYRQGDESDLADKIRKAIDDPGLANAIGKTGKELAQKKFDYHVYANELVGFFGSLR